jgi:hypothetical protein
MPRQAIVTVVTRNYLHYANCLSESCRRWLPNCDFHIVLIDGLPPSYTPSEQTSIIPADQLGIPNWKRFAFQYTPFELSCALKPYAMSFLMNQGYQQTIFLDADICVYSPLDSIAQGLERSSIVLTSHLLQGLPEDGKRPTHNAYLTSGAFNGGLVACRNDREGQEFLGWWANRLKSECYVDQSKGVFVDQKWLDLVPSLFSNVHIVRNPGCNTGHWTLSQFAFSGDRSSGFRVGNHPLECFHFSNFLPTDPFEFMRTQTRVTFAGTPALEQLVTDYHAALQRDGAAQYARLGCELDAMNDGTPIKPEWREAIRRQHKEFVGLEDPFDAKSNKDLLPSFRSIEAKAVKWRTDWRLCSPSKQKQIQSKRKWRNYWRYLRSRLIW